MRSSARAAIFNHCEETGKVFAIGADQDGAVKGAITAIPEGDWKKFRDGEIAARRRAGG